MALFLLVFSLLSCSASCRQWQFSGFPVDSPCTSYSRGFLASTNTFNGLEAEFLSDGKEVQFFLSALTMQIPTLGENEGWSEVKVTIDNQVYRFTAICFEGGQKLKMPTEAALLVSHALIDNQVVEIRSGRYQTQLIPNNFDSVYAKLF